MTVLESLVDIVVAETTHHLIYQIFIFSYEFQIDIAFAYILKHQQTAKKSNIAIHKYYYYFEGTLKVPFSLPGNETYGPNRANNAEHVRCEIFHFLLQLPPVYLSNKKRQLIPEYSGSTGWNVQCAIENGIAVENEHRNINGFKNKLLS